MIIIIDGYNLLHAMYDEHSRKKLIAFLDKYAKTKTYQIKLIFDAGPDYYPTTQRGDKVSIIFSGQMQSADEYIRQYLSDYRNQDILLVTSDKEIIETARRYDISWIASRDFGDIIRDRMKKRKSYAQVVKTDVIKLRKENDSELDLLMQQASDDIPDYESDEDESESVDILEKKRRKKDKKLWQKIKKL